MNQMGFVHSLTHRCLLSTFPISIFSPQNSFFGSQLMWDFFNSYRECMHLLHACLLAWSVCSWYDHLCSFHLLILSRKQMGLCVYMKFLLFIVLAFWKQEFLVKSWIADKQATKQIDPFACLSIHFHLKRAGEVSVFSHLTINECACHLC